MRSRCPVCFRPSATDRDDLLFRLRGDFWTDQDPGGGAMCWERFDPGSCSPFAAMVSSLLERCVNGRQGRRSDAR
jgi:hypothetical protein